MSKIAHQHNYIIVFAGGKTEHNSWHPTSYITVNVVVLIYKTDNITLHRAVIFI